MQLLSFFSPVNLSARWQGVVFVLRQPLHWNFYKNKLLNGNYLLLAYVEEKTTTTTFFIFSPPFLNKAKFCQPNRNWQHSFKKQNKAHPSWALTRLLYLCLTCWAHVQFSFPWSEQACCTLSSPVPVAHLSFLSASRSMSPLHPGAVQLIQAPRSSSDPCSGSSHKLWHNSSLSFLQTSRTASKGCKLTLTLPETHPKENFQALLRFPQSIIPYLVWHEKLKNL